MHTTSRCLSASRRLHAFRRFSLAALLAASAALTHPLVLPSASGATLYTWTGQFSNLWSNGNSWQGNAAPPSDLANTDLLFGASNTTTSSINTAYSVHQITFNGSAPAYTFGGSTLTLGAGGIVQNSAQAETFNNAVVLGADQTWTLASGAGELNFTSGLNTNGGPGFFAHTLTLNAGLTAGSIDLNGVITGGGGLVKTGAGTLNLNSTETYTGSTTINGGILSIGNGGTAGALPAASNIIDNATLAFNHSDNLTIANNISGTGGITHSTPTTLTLTGANTYSGTTAISAGSTVSMGNGGTGGSLGSGAIVDNGTLIFNRSSSATAANVISGAGTLTQAGGGTLTLTGANTYTGTTFVNAGTLSVGTGGSLGDTNITVAAGAAFALAGTGTVNSNVARLSLSGTSANPATATFSGGNATLGSIFVGDDGSSVGAVVQTSGAVSVQTSGGFRLGNSFFSTGSYTLSGAGASLSTGDAYVGFSGAGTFVQSAGYFSTNGGKLYLGYNTGGSGNYTLSGSGVLQTVVTQVSDDNNASVFTQNGGVHSTGALALSGFDSRSQGTYNLNGGTLIPGLVTSGDIGVSGTSTFNFNGGTLQAAGNNGAFFQGLTTANVRTGGALIDSQNFSVALAQPLLHDTTAGAGAIDGGLTKLGAGTLALINTGASTFTGPTTISAGTLALGNGGTAGSLPNTAVIDNAALAFNRSNALTVPSAISGTGGVTQSGAGVTTLTGASTYTGPTAVNAGRLAIGNGGSIGDSTITVGAGASFAVTGTGAFTSASANLVVDGTAASPATATFGGSAVLSRGSVFVGNAGTGTVTQSSGTLNIAAGGGTFIVGNRAGSSGTYNQTGGSVSVLGTPGYFELGSEAGSKGTYNLSGANSSLSTDYPFVGLDGVGTFNQSGGSFSTNGTTLYVGVNATASGSAFNLSGGTLTTGATHVSDDANTSSFTQTGGLHTTGTLAISGYSTLSNGTYTLAGGTLNAGQVTGISGTSTFHFAGGTLQAGASTAAFMQGLTVADVQAGGAKIDSNGFNITIAQNLVHDTTAGAGATDGGLTKLGAGALTLSSVNTYAGDTTVSAGTLALTGSLNNTSTVIVDGTSAAAATLNVSGATSTVNTSTLYVGRFGSGTFNQTGGSVSVRGPFGYFAVGSEAGSSGTYNLSGTNSSLSTGSAYVGVNGVGTFNQSGGSFSTNGGRLYVGVNATASGSAFNLSGGTLTTSRTQVSDDANTSSFTQTGGLHTTGTLAISGYSTLSNGTYTLAGGTLNAGSIVNRGENGISGTSTFHFAGGTLQAGASTAAFMQGLTVADVQAGGAKIDSNGFNITIAQNLVHDTTAGAGATDGGLTKLGAGALTLSSVNTYAGNTTISAGTLALTGSLNNTSTVTVDGTSAAAATLNLSGANSSLNTSTLNVGRFGSGTVNQTGGSVSVLGIFADFEVGNKAGSNGTYNQTGGSVSVLGSFSDFQVGSETGSRGTYNLSGANSSLSTGYAYVGYDGVGTFNQSGGSFSTNGSPLYVGFDASASGSAFNLSGGTLTTDRTQVSDDANTSSFTQTGGLHTTGTLGLSGYNTLSNGTYTLAGGTLNAGSIVNRGENGISGTSTFHFAGGTLQAGASTAAFMQGLTVADVQAGGAKIDTNGFDITVAQNLVHDTSAGASGFDGGLTKLGAGTLTLSGVNTFAGPLNINAGTLAVAAESALGAGSTVTVGGGGQLQFTGSATLGRNYNLGVSSLSAASGSTLTFGGGTTINAGFLTGPGAFVLGDGATLNATRLGTGASLTQNAATTAAFQNVTIAGNASFTQAAGATLNSTGDFLTTPPTTVNVSGTFNTTGGSISGALNINNGGRFNESGSATPLYLNGSRGTTVNAGGQLNASAGSSIELGGLLVNNGTQTGTLNVNASGIVRGSGSFGTVNVGADGRFSPGNGPGAATVNTLFFASGGTYRFELASTEAMQSPSGSTMDFTQVNGELRINAGVTANTRFTIALVSLDGSDNPAALGDFDPNRSYRFVLASAGAGIVGFDPAAFIVDTTGFRNSLAGGSFSVARDGNDLDLVFTNAVPEPGTWAFLLVGCGALGFLVRCGRFSGR